MDSSNSSNSSDYSYFTETKVKYFEQKLLNENNCFYQIFVFKNDDIIGRTFGSIIIISQYGEKKIAINENIQNYKNSISSMILLKNEELLYCAHSTIYCINFKKNNYEYYVINLIPLKLKEKTEIYQFYETKDEKIICSTNSTYYMIIQKSKSGNYQIILNIIDDKVINHGIYELNKYIIFINHMLNIQFYDKISFSYVNTINLSKYLNIIKENIEFKKKLCLNNIIMGINDNIIAVATLGKGILIINIINFVVIKKILNIDFTCWTKLNDGSIITCEYSDNKNLIRMEQWDINENGKDWNVVSKKDCIHNDFVYSICCDNNNNIYTSGNDNKLKCWEIHSYSYFKDDD